MRARILPRSSGFDRRWLTLIVTTIGSFMSILDSTIVNVALPDILRDFGANLERGQLVLTGYLLALAIVIPLSGFLAERIGMKRLYLITLACFTLGSALCGLAWNLPSLIGFRVIQGLGGGMIQPLGMAIVFTMITPRERASFMGLLGLPMLLAPLLGPTLGGYLVEYVSWRFIFLINLPIGVANIILAWLLLKEMPRRPEARFDAPGFVLALIGFPSLLLALSEGSAYGWTSPLVLGLGTVGVTALIALVVLERRLAEPLLQIRLFSHPMFALAMSINFVTQFSLFGMTYLLPLLLQQAHGLGAAATGWALFPSGVMSFITMNVGGALYNRVGPRRLALSGLAVLVVATGMLSRTSAETAIWVIAALASLRGVAMGLCMMPVQTVAYNTVPDGQMPRATALTSVLFRLFGSASTAILTAVLVIGLQLNGAPGGATITSGAVSSDALFSAFDLAFVVMAVMAAGGMVLALFLKDPVIEEMKAEQRDAAVERHAFAAE
ncbi:MAG: DHA2 family efflux MFS transporter permease subunit [Dehalococcoidia bacterium]